MGLSDKGDMQNVQLGRPGTCLRTTEIGHYLAEIQLFEKLESESAEKKKIIIEKIAFKAVQNEVLSYANY